VDVEKDGKDLGIYLELKYCERCGGIFLRLQRSVIDCCRACQTRWSTLIDRNKVTVQRGVEAWYRQRPKLDRARTEQRQRRVPVLRGRNALEVQA